MQLLLILHEFMSLIFVNTPVPEVCYILIRVEQESDIYKCHLHSKCKKAHRS